MKLSPHEKQVDEDMTEKPKHSLPEEKLSFQSCNLLNISSCPISERHSRFVVTVYNPQSQNVSKYVRLPIVNQATYTVYDPEGMYNNLLLLTPIVFFFFFSLGRKSTSSICNNEGPQANVIY